MTRRALLGISWFCLLSSAALAQTLTIRGTVADSETGLPLAGANVVLRSEQSVNAYGASTDSAGVFAINGVMPGIYRLSVSFIGFHDHVRERLILTISGQLRFAISLTPSSVELEPVEVSAPKQTIDRRSTEKLQDIASVIILDTLTLQSRQALTAADHLVGLAGVDVVKTGLNQNHVAVRGFNDIFSGSLLLMVDNRIGRVPSLRFNAYSFIPTAENDIERIEVIRGPAASLYGPNSANGVLHIVTKSPFGSEGTSMSFGVGQRNAFTADLRYATSVKQRFGFKVTASYLQGFDFESRDAFEDSLRSRLYAADQSYRQRGLRNPDPLDDNDKRIAMRDFAVRKIGVTSELNYRFKPDLSLVLNTGYNLATNMELTPIGAALVDNWRYLYGQAKLIYHNLFVQGFVNASHSGDSYSTRDGHDLMDRSKLMTFQIQNTTNLGSRQVFTYGLDRLWTRPATGGSVNGIHEDDDAIDETGLYLQSETALSYRLKFILAGRLDRNNRIEGTFFSPRAGLVYAFDPDNKARFSFGRAFSTPTPENLFLDRLVSPLIPDRTISFSAFAPYQPFNVRVRGVPKTGLTFSRDSVTGIDGLYMQPVPLYQPPPGNAGLVPADATLMWDKLIDLFTNLVSTGLDYTFTPLRNMPAPTYSDVATSLKLFNTATGQYQAISPELVGNIMPLKSTETTSYEVGYQGIFARKLLFSADVYHNRVKNFIGPLLLETPNVFLDRSSLENYLLQQFPIIDPNNPENIYVSASRILARLMSEVPLGTIVPDESIHPGDLMLTYRNFGDINLTGVDLDMTYLASSSFSIRGVYSYVSKDLFTDVDQVRDIALNAPQHKFSLALSYHQAKTGLGWGLRYRYVDGFPINSGIFVGAIPAYGLLDVSAGVNLPGKSGIRLLLTLQNVLDNKHLEFVGAPKIGRFSMLQIQMFPDKYE